MEAIMAQIVSRLEEVIAQHRPLLPTNSVTAQIIDDSHVDGNDEIVRLIDAKGLLAPYGAGRFEDLRCPICGHFACGGC